MKIKVLSTFSKVAWFGAAPQGFELTVISDRTDSILNIK